MTAPEGLTAGRRTPRWVVFLLAGSVLAAALVGGLVWTMTGDEPVPGITRDPPRSVEGLTFTELDASGEVADATLRAPDGGLTVAYFGFLSCPDVCPLTMSDLGRARRDLDPAVDDRLDVAFVTLDPERDDGEAMRDYLGHFLEDGYRALRAPDTASLDAAAEQLGVTYEIEAHEPGDDEYGVTHSAVTYLVDDRGQVVRELPFGVTAEEFATAIEASLPAA